MTPARRPRSGRSHLILTHIVGIEAFQPLLNVLWVQILFFQADVAAVVDDLFSDIDGRVGPQGQGDGIAGATVNGNVIPVHSKVNNSIEGISLQVGNHDLVHVGIELQQNILDQVMGQGSRGIDSLNLQGNGIGLEDSYPDGQ